MLYSEKWKYFLAYSLKFSNGYQYSNVKINATYGLPEWLSNKIKTNQSIIHKLTLWPNNSFKISIDNTIVHGDSLRNLTTLERRDYGMNQISCSPNLYKNNNINKIRIRFLNSGSAVVIDDILVATFHSKGKRLFERNLIFYSKPKFNFQNLNWSPKQINVPQVKFQLVLG